MISFRSVHKSFGKNQVLKGINLDLSGNCISAILGPNSSGKTTLMKSLLGMVIPDSGEITLDNTSIKKSWDYRNKIGYLPQIARFPENLKVNELLKMIRDIRNTEVVNHDLIDYFELDEFMKVPLGQLSGGTRQKVNIVQAFMFDAPILVLDEPTAGLDPVSLIKLKDLILAEKEKGKTILITSHIMSFVEEMAEQLVFILDGKIHFKGQPEKIKSDYMAPNLERAIANILKGIPPIGSSNGHAIQKENIIPQKLSDKDNV